MTNLEARKFFNDDGISYLEFNNGLHMRIVLSQFKMDGHIDFWPSKEKWIYGEKHDIGINSLIKYLKQLEELNSVAVKAGVRILSVDQIFDIAKKVKTPNLYNVCEAIRKAIYK